MAIKAECPACHRKQAVSNKLCDCGQDLDRAKKGKKVRYHITYRLNGKQKQEFVGYSVEEARTAEAGRKVQKRENRLEDMLDIQAEARESFSDLTAWYLPLELARCRNKGRKVYGRRARCLANFNLVFGKTTVKDITQADLERYRMDRLEAGISKRTVDMEIGEVKRMVKVAFNNNRVSARTMRVFNAVEKLLEAGENIRKRKLTLKEFVKVLDQLPAERKSLFELALYTGMRPGELVPINRYSEEEGTRGLTWDRIDYRDRVIRLEAEDTKTGESRSIPITDEILAILRRIPRDLRCGHVFTHRGKPLSDIRGSIKKACKEADVAFGRDAENGFVFRDLRRTADTLMVRAGIPDVYRRTLLGHTLKGMDRHYVHPDLETDLRPAMATYTRWLKVEIETQRKGQVAAC
jgi:integrase